MTLYKDLDGDSGVSAYEIGGDSIKVQFKDGSVYLYDYTRPGRDKVDEMKRLAVSGDGLNSYINRHVRKAYAAKLR